MSDHIPAQILGVWPPPAQVGVARGRVDDADSYHVVPSLRRPRYLVPTDVAGAQRMFSRHGGSRADRVARRLWRRAHTLGIADRLPVSRIVVRPEPEGIEAYLGAVIGAPARIGVLLGPPRANQKPVLQVFGPDGETVAFAKLGLTPLSATLLETEASALRLLGDRDLRAFDVPQLLDHGTWKGVPILVQGALDLAQSDASTAPPPLEVMVEIATISGIEVEDYAHSAFSQGVAPTGGDTWHGIDVAAFGRVHEQLTAWGPLPMGAWHGDFGPWNLARSGDTTQVWDWERFEVGVPVGLDAAHYRAQQGVAAQTEPSVAWAGIVAAVGAVLAAAGCDAAAAPAVGAAYLLAIVARYRADAGPEPTAALQRRMTWLSSVAAVALAEIQEPAP